jgi:hypothetical protein
MYKNIEGERERERENEAMRNLFTGSHNFLYNSWSFDFDLSLSFCLVFILFYKYTLISNINIISLESNFYYKIRLFLSS